VLGFRYPNEKVSWVVVVWILVYVVDDFVKREISSCNGRPKEAV